jgi:hypothetical protein
MAGEGDKNESGRKLRPSGLLGGLGRASGSAPDAERRGDGLPEERLEDVEVYVESFPSEDDDRTRANEDLRGYSTRE